jgi:hypothetical protein
LSALLGLSQQRPQVIRRPGEPLQVIAANPLDDEFFRDLMLGSIPKTLLEIKGDNLVLMYLTPEYMPTLVTGTRKVFEAIVSYDRCVAAILHTDVKPLTFGLKENLAQFIEHNKEFNLLKEEYTIEQEKEFTVRFLGDRTTRMLLLGGSGFLIGLAFGPLALGPSVEDYWLC